MTDSSTPPPPDNSRVEDLEAQNAELKTQLADKKRSGWRMNVAMLFVVLFAIALGLTNQAVWLATTALDTEQFVATFAPLPSDPAVSASLGTRFAESVVEKNDIQAAIADPLPGGLEFIAVPLTNAVEGVIAEAATRIISSDAFSTIWENALRITHRSALLIIEGGRNENIVTDEGVVTLDLNELVAQVDDALTERGLDVLDAESIDASIVLYESEGLGVVQSIVTIVYQIRWFVPIATLVLLLGAVFIATDRRRVTVWLGVAAAITMVLLLIEARWLRSQVLEGIADPIHAEGTDAALAIVFDRYLAQIWAVLVLGAVVAGAAWVMGPSERAESLRNRFLNPGDSAGAPDDSELTAFVARHLRALQWLTVALGVGSLLLIPSVTGIIVLFVAAAVVAIVLVLEWLAGGQTAEQ